MFCEIMVYPFMMISISIIDICIGNQEDKCYNTWYKNYVVEMEFSLSASDFH